MNKRRARWPMVAISLAALCGVVVRFAVFHVTRELPNYSEIEAGLWLGGSVSSPPPQTSAVLNLCEVEDRYAVPHQRWEPINDAPPPPSIEWLSQQVDFITTQRQAGRVVFVHCRNGVSRSPMVLAAYLMKREGWSRDEALQFLRSRRAVVRPNPAFMPLLSEWEELQSATRHQASSER